MHSDYESFKADVTFGFLNARGFGTAWQARCSAVQAIFGHLELEVAGPNNACLSGRFFWKLKKWKITNGCSVFISFVSLEIEYVHSVFSCQFSGLKNNNFTYLEKVKIEHRFFCSFLHSIQSKSKETSSTNTSSVPSLVPNFRWLTHNLRPCYTKRFLLQVAPQRLLRCKLHEKIHV